MRPVIQCHQSNLLLNGCEACGASAAVPNVPGVTTVAQVLPFIDLMDLCQAAEVPSRSRPRSVPKWIHVSTCGSVSSDSSDETPGHDVIGS